ncbi:hypothetical protein N0V88_006688 [Collariella sp. IMI 366227]|nr:hypothetical protein N0V88_006688 [Collariella sp. IMI 366227]
METVFCECKKCDAPIGRFANLWTQIGKGYFSPVVEPEDDLAVKCKGTVRIGERNTLVEEWCIQTPVNHVLDENQLLLRLASVELLDNEGQEIEFAIKRVLSVNEPSKTSSSKIPDPSQGPGFASAFPGGVEIQKLQTDLRNQREDIKRIDSNGFRIVSVLDKRTSRIEREVAKQGGVLGGFNRNVEGLKQELMSVKDEIRKLGASGQDTTVLVTLQDRLSSLSSTCADVSALGAQFQTDIHELKLELNRQHQDIEDLRPEVRASVTAAEHAEDMATLRAEMAQMRRQMEVCTRGTGREGAAFPSRELDVLTSNIAKIGSRASQVETLQMELEMLKGRVDRAEASRKLGDHRQAHSVDQGVYPDILPSMRKRGASPGLDYAVKRPASSVGYSDFADRRHTMPFAWPENPTAASRDVPDIEVISTLPTAAKRGRKTLRGRTTSTSSDMASRLRKR